MKYADSDAHEPSDASPRIVNGLTVRPRKGQPLVLWDLPAAGLCGDAGRGRHGHAVAFETF